MAMEGSIKILSFCFLFYLYFYVLLYQYFLYILYVFVLFLFACFFYFDRSNHLCSFLVFYSYMKTCRQLF